MSYILDALRKADSERERGSVPGLHAQPVPPSSDEGVRPATGAWLKVAVALLVVLVLALLAWLLMEREALRDATLAAARAPQSPALNPSSVMTTAPGMNLPVPPATGTAAASPQGDGSRGASQGVSPTDTAGGRPANAPATGAPTTSAARTGASASPPTGTAANTWPPPTAGAAPRAEATPAAARRPSATAPVTAPAAPVARARSNDAEAVQSRAAAATRSSSNTTVASPPSRRAAPKDETTDTTPAEAASGPIYQLKELPEDIRRELPTLNIGGSIHSKTAADRLLIIHGQLFHEGDQLAPGLTLEQIRLKSAVLRYKGYRYELTF